MDIKLQQKGINHLFYLDNLKLYVKNDDDLEGLLSTVKRFIHDTWIWSGQMCRNYI